MKYNRTAKKQKQSFGRGAQVIPFRTKMRRKDADVVFIPIVGTQKQLASAAYLASVADQSFEGRMIAEQALLVAGSIEVPEKAKLIPLTVTSFTSGIEYSGKVLRKGSLFGLEKWLDDTGTEVQKRVLVLVDEISVRGDRAFLVVDETRVIGVICIKRRSI